jgi:hypothetical protein
MPCVVEPLEERPEIQSPLGLNKGGEDDDVREIVPSLRIEYATTRHKLQCGIVPSPINECVRKVRLLVHAFTDDGEDQLATIGQSDVNPIAEFQLVEMKKDRGTVVVVDVTEDDRRTLLAG